jgi:hypothetical protein
MNNEPSLRTIDHTPGSGKTATAYIFHHLESRSINTLYNRLERILTIVYVVQSYWA